MDKLFTNYSNKNFINHQIITIMKKINGILWALFAVFALTFVSCTSGNQEGAEDDSEYADSAEDESESEEETDEEGGEEASSEALPSPRQQAAGDIDGVAISVDYGSPAVKGRTVWGGLETYGVVWRAGANETTSIEFSENVTINGQELAAGKYAIFMIPNENEDWVVIFNNGWDAWGAFSYAEGQDVLRVATTPEWSDEVSERLTYTVGESLEFAWEKARINLDVKAQ